MRILFFAFILFGKGILICPVPAAAQQTAQHLAQGRPAKTVTVEINLHTKFQTVQHFGASDAWACQFVGLWPETKKNAIADLLFSTELNAKGSPKGIGLTMWRFNVGAGSAQQGEASGIKDEWRRAESFIEPDGSYNWQRQAGQVWFLKAAQRRGVPFFLAFVNSPPVCFTKNGKAYASDKVPNLAPEKYGAFANYLADVVQGLKSEHGISFQYMSPVNEPQWEWSDPKQEGTPYQNEHITGIVRALDGVLVSRRMPVMIDFAEAAKIDYLFQPGDKPYRGNQIESFFREGSPHYLANLPSVHRNISGHSYFTTSPEETSVAKRRQLAQKVASMPGLSFWQSEYCILGDNNGEIDGRKRDLGIEPALYVARVIHQDLTIAHAAAWHWWLAISAYNYKDGLIYVDKNKDDGNFYPSKMLWALGNYSRFIRPGAVRVNAQVTNQPEAEDKTGVLVSSFLNQPKGELVTVVINNSETSMPLQLTIDGAKPRSTAVYVTSATQDLEKLEKSKTKKRILVPPRSVATLVTDIR
ncbi:MAG: glycoside hydrolase [Rufibacter sp.]